MPKLEKQQLQECCTTVPLQLEMYLRVRSDKLDCRISAHHKYLKTNTHAFTSKHHWI